MVTYTVGTGGTYANWAAVSWSSGNTYDGQGQTFKEIVTAGASDVIVRNLTIDAENTRDRCFLAYQKNNVTLEDAIILNSRDASSCEGAKFSGIGGYGGHTIQRVQFQNCLKFSLFVATQANVTVKECTISGETEYGVYFENSCTGMQVLDNNLDITNPVFATGICIKSSLNATGKVYRNIVKNDSGDGIMVLSSSYVDVISNIIPDGYNDGIAAEDSSYVNIYYNTVGKAKATNYPGIKLGNNFGAGTASNYCNIKYNVMQAPLGGYCLVCDPCGANCTFDRNMYGQTGNVIKMNDGTVNARYDLAGLQAATTYEDTGLQEALELDSNYIPCTLSTKSKGVWLPSTLDIRKKFLPISPDLGAIQDDNTPGRRSGPGGRL